ncbi:unnamed protein product [Rhizophagus irregularis]|nr:unnamed protein product [Rhizophagus irregularis]
MYAFCPFINYLDSSPINCERLRHNLFYIESHPHVIYAQKKTEFQDYKDSQQLRSISTINKWESDTDNYIMMDHVQPIKENRNTEWVVKENNLDLNLHKVKGHSGNLWNDKVDELAKQASSSTSASNIVQFNQGHDGLNFVPMINEVPVEQKLRKFVKNVMNFVNDGQWSQLSCNQDALLDRTKDYDWDITWNALKQVKHFKCTSSKHNKL